jgi:pimeloyl-ACP methyl ester carboxylesterase
MIQKGLSMGGCVGCYFASKYPEKLLSLILISPAVVPVEMPFLAR